jgi:hydroxypyruvate isomerase
MWRDLDEYARFSAAARGGFTRVEMHSPQKLDATRIERLPADTGLELVLFNQMVRYDERGQLSASDGRARFLASLKNAIDLAERLGTPEFMSSPASFPICATPRRRSG